MQMPPKSTDTNLNPQTQEHFLLSFERPASSSEDNTLLTSSDKLTIVLCTRGCKTVQLNFTEYVLEPGSIAFLYPNTIWKPIKTSSDFQARYLSMREHSPKERNAFLDLETIFSLSTYIARHPHTSLSANESIVVEGYFRLMYRASADSTGKSNPSDNRTSHSAFDGKHHYLSVLVWNSYIRTNAPE
jgi:hypothetical protein